MATITERFPTPQESIREIKHPLPVVALLKAIGSFTEEVLDKFNEATRCKTRFPDLRKGPDYSLKSFPLLKSLQKRNSSRF